MSYTYGNYGYRRVDYSPPLDEAQKPIEQAMAMFVSWARAHNRNYFGSLVKSNLESELRAGATPEQAVRNLLARAPA